MEKEKGPGIQPDFWPDRDLSEEKINKINAEFRKAAKKDKEKGVVELSKEETTEIIGEGEPSEVPPNEENLRRTKELIKELDRRAEEAKKKDSKINKNK